jgi:hypothetical protein
VRGEKREARRSPERYGERLGTVRRREARAARTASSGSVEV